MMEKEGFLFFFSFLPSGGTRKNSETMRESGRERESERKGKSYRSIVIGIIL